MRVKAVAGEGGEPADGPRRALGGLLRGRAARVGARAPGAESRAALGSAGARGPALAGPQAAGAPDPLRQDAVVASAAGAEADRAPGTVGGRTARLRAEVHAAHGRIERRCLGELIRADH